MGAPTPDLLYRRQEHHDGPSQSGIEWRMNETYQRLNELLATMG